MRTIAFLCCVGFGLVIGGCSATESGTTTSKIVSPDSEEFSQGTAAQDEYVRQSKEAERKALGGHSIEE
jgi:hypothetical protein